jgi:energy-coupling factor transporter ATP-binding protein EcfA2
MGRHFAKAFSIGALQYFCQHCRPLIMARPLPAWQGCRGPFGGSEAVNRIPRHATTGLIVVSGPTGSGKSTTLAALVEEVNTSRARNIITLESPLEYVFANRRSFIRQREIPTHSPSFEQAIVDALRENPDVLVIGEMRTPEVIRLTLNAAETGHLVLATLHSASCIEAPSRICIPPRAGNEGRYSCHRRCLLHNEGTGGEVRTRKNDLAMESHPGELLLDVSPQVSGE